MTWGAAGAPSVPGVRGPPLALALVRLLARGKPVTDAMLAAAPAADR